MTLRLLPPPLMNHVYRADAVEASASVRRCYAV